MRFYSQFLDSAPSVLAFVGSSGPRRYQGWPQNLGHCPRIGYRRSFLNIYYANLAKTTKMGQNSQKQDDKKNLFKLQKPPKRGSLMTILHKYSKKCPKPQIQDFGYICMPTHCALQCKSTTLFRLSRLSVHPSLALRPCVTNFFFA